jgi:hypothetical protein
MQTLRLTTLALTLAMLAGCGGSQSPMPQGLSPQARVHRGSETTGDLLYVCCNSKNVMILTYPGGQYYGQFALLQPSAYGICSDKSSGNVWVVEGVNKVYEYAHGGTSPIQTLTVPSTDLATQCAVDPKTGNLAVVSDGDPSGPSVDVWVGGQGTPTIYSIPFYQATVTYDDNSDLFADGSTGNPSNIFEMADLKKGQSSFALLHFTAKTDWPGSLQWDGKYLAVGTAGDKLSPRVYRTKVSGSNIQVKKALYFQHRQRGYIYFVLQGNTLISGADRNYNYDVALWAYPKAGKPYKTFSSVQGDMLTVSVAPPH